PLYGGAINERILPIQIWKKSSNDVYKADKSSLFSNEHRNESYSYIVCVVPLPNFTRYPEPPESRLGFLNVFGWHNYLSPFASAVLQGRYDLFGEPAMEAVINFKWRKFARTRYIFLTGIYFLYLTSFMATVTLDSERVQPSSRTENLIKLSSFVVLLLGIMFTGLEMMQIIAYRSYYLTIYNVIGLASTVLPIIYTVEVLLGSNSRRQYVGSAMFFVYINLILQLRVFKLFGIPIFIITTIIARVQGLMYILAIMMLASAHIYWLLFSFTEVTDLVGDSTVINGFSTPLRSLTSVYFFMTGGDFGSITDAFGNATIVILTITVSFIGTVVSFNIWIALMGDIIADSKLDSKCFWLKLKAELICELEMCTLTRKQRQRADFFPYLIYYYANDDSIIEYKKRLEK
ncbi:199_t:CDS:2, partial [Paraglomus occultum]